MELKIGDEVIYKPNNCKYTIVMIKNDEYHISPMKTIYNGKADRVVTKDFLTKIENKVYCKDCNFFQNEADMHERCQYRAMYGIEEASGLLKTKLIKRTIESNKNNNCSDFNECSLLVKWIRGLIY